MLSLTSLLALGVIAASLGAAFTKRFPATGALMVGNIGVHIIRSFSPEVAVCRGGSVCGPGATLPDVIAVRPVVTQELGLHPEMLAGGEPLAFLQLLTHMFVHADFFHLLGNLIVLLAFALPFEERIGHRAFLGVYLLSGFVAAFAQLAPGWGDPVLMIGASGAVFGIIGAFAGSYPNLVVPLPLPLGFIMVFVRMRVIVGAAIFGVQQVLLQYLSAYNTGDNTAYFAHLGGLVAGVVLGVTYVRSRRAVVGQKSRVVLDIRNLSPFVQDDGTRRAYGHLQVSTDEPEVFEAWLERFFVSARCPVCGGAVAPRKHEVVCTHGHRFDMRQGSSPGPDSAFT